MNVFGSRIHRIFNQLLNDGSRTLNHFTSRNLVGNGIRKQLDDVGHRTNGTNETNGSYQFFLGLLERVGLRAVPSFFPRQTKMSCLESGRM